MKRVSLAAVAVGALLALTACRAGDVQPASFDVAHEACAHCRMTGSNGRAVAQLVVPGEEPLFFDDIGCLSDYLAKTTVPDTGVAFVTDYGTRQWVRADAAAYVRQPSIDTAMGSHLIAFASASARDASPDAKGAEPVVVDTILRKPR